MLTLEELKRKYPTFPVKNCPLPDCPICKGEGEYINGHKHVHVCACVCLGGDDKVRAMMILAFKKTVESLVKSKKEKD